MNLTEKFKSWLTFNRRANEYVLKFLEHKGFKNLEYRYENLLYKCYCRKNERFVDGEFVQRELTPFYYLSASDHEYAIEFEDKQIHINVSGKCVCGKRYYWWQ